MRQPKTPNREIAFLLRAEGHNQNTIARMLGVSRQRVSQWLHQEFKPCRPAKWLKVIPPALDRIREMRASGCYWKEVCAELGVPESSLKSYIKFSDFPRPNIDKNNTYVKKGRA